MIKAYKTELNPTEEQKKIINRNLGICRYLYNFYLREAFDAISNKTKIKSAYEFTKWINNEYLSNNPNMEWLKVPGSKATSYMVKHAETIFRKWLFKKEIGRPHFKKKKDNNVKIYFVKNGKNRYIKCERHRICLPIIGWVRLKEKGYIPTNPDTHIIKSGYISKKAGRYYVSVVIEEADNKIDSLNDYGIGIDLGIINYVTLSNGTVYPNINRNKSIKKIKQRIKRLQRACDRKRVAHKKLGLSKDQINKNYEKNKLKIQKLYQRLNNIRVNYINQIINDIVNLRPKYITMETLYIRKMMKNKVIVGDLFDAKFYEFRDKLKHKCLKLGIEFRLVDQFYPSSKLCSRCNYKNNNLKLSDRIYVCPECGLEIDRDLNAAINLKNATEYKSYINE